MARNGLARDLYELLSAMHFAVSLLTVLAIAVIVGTVLKQAEPYPNNVVRFGQFCARYLKKRQGCMTFTTPAGSCSF